MSIDLEKQKKIDGLVAQIKEIAEIDKDEKNVFAICVGSVSVGGTTEVIGEITGLTLAIADMLRAVVKSSGVPTERVLASVKMAMCVLEGKDRERAGWLS